MWQQMLTDAGLGVLVTDADHVRLRAASGAEMTFETKVLTWVPSPAQLPRPSGPAGLLVVPRATARVLAAAQAYGWSVVTDAGSARIQLAGQRIVLDAPRPTDPAGATGPRHRVPWATLTIVRALLAEAPLLQRELAVRAGTSQARVSQVLAPLAAAGLVRRGPAGYQPVDWDALADWWLSRYPGHRGASSYWHSLDDLRTQVRAATGPLAAVEGGSPVLSGEVAADLIAPWRRPVQAVIYAHRLTDLTGLGFVPTTGPADATLVLHAPKDPGVWPAHPWTRDVDGHPVALADPMQILFDLAGSLWQDEGPDDKEAITRFRDTIFRRA
ncbi:MAG: MarR family transcriptional regulator [Actinomycetota bacterium]|nr:MarR family transcriptional regulator [Actinomycetota bacterium]